MRIKVHMKFQVKCSYILTHVQYQVMIKFCPAPTGKMTEYLICCHLFFSTRPYTGLCININYGYPVSRKFMEDVTHTVDTADDFDVKAESFERCLRTGKLAA